MLFKRRERALYVLSNLGVKDEKFKDVLERCRKYIKKYYRQRILYLALCVMYIFTWYNFRFAFNSVLGYVDLVFMLGVIVVYRVRPKFNLKEEISYLNEVLEKVSKKVLDATWKKQEDGSYILDAVDSDFGRFTFAVNIKDVDREGELCRWFSVSNNFIVYTKLRLNKKDDVKLLEER